LTLSPIHNTRRHVALPRHLMVRYRILIPFIEVRVLAGHPDRPGIQAAAFNMNCKATDLT
jgi:hypothetical protein